jgi:hypothetical protein
MINPNTIGMMLIVVVAAASALVATQNAVATICPPMCAADIDEEEDVQAGNITMMTNQTAGGNMTGGTNSTS